MRRDIEYFVIIAICIGLAMFALIKVGTTYESGLFCKGCVAKSPFDNYGDIKEKVVQYLTYIPLFIFRKMHLTVSSNTDINYAIGLIMAFFIFFGAIALFYWLLRKLLILIFQKETTALDNQ